MRTIIALLKDAARRHGDHPYLVGKTDGGWRETSFSEADARSDEVAAWMLSYWSNTTAAVEHFGIPEAPLSPLRDGWLWTGDQGYLDQDGFLFLFIGFSFEDPMGRELLEKVKGSGSRRHFAFVDEPAATRAEALGIDPILVEERSEIAEGLESIYIGAWPSSEWESSDLAGPGGYGKRLLAGLQGRA